MKKKKKRKKSVVEIALIQLQGLPVLLQAPLLRSSSAAANSRAGASEAVMVTDCGLNPSP